MRQIQNFQGSTPFSDVLLTLPLPFGLSLEGCRRAADQEYLLCDFSQGRNWGSPACRFHGPFGPFRRWLQHVTFSHHFRGSVSLAIVASPRDGSLAPSTLGRFHLLQLPQCAWSTAVQGSSSAAEWEAGRSKACPPWPLGREGRDAEEKSASLLYWHGQAARQWVGDMLS